MRRGEGEFRTTDTQLTAAIEAKPAKPEQTSAEKDLAHIVRWSH